MTRIPITTLGISLLLAGCAMEPGAAVPQDSDEPSGETAPTRIRIALFNIRELSTTKLTTVDARGRGIDPQARAAATIIQRVQPDVLVIDEIDHDYGSHGADLALNARRFATAYLATGQEPLHLGFAFAAANNTGILSNVDLDGDGHVATAADVGKQEHGNDSFGFGLYPG